MTNEIRDWLKRWDAGETLWSIEMGGLGPGYEQAIQVLFVEIVRDNASNPLPSVHDRAWGDATVSRIDYRLPDGGFAMGGFSGAQVGAAKQMAYRLIMEGPQGFEASIPEGRRILISRYFPKSPEGGTVCLPTS